MLKYCGLAVTAVVAPGLAVAPSARAALGDFQYGSLATLSPINPSSTVGGPGSQISQAGIGNFASPAAPTFNAALLPTGANITVGTVTITDLALGAPYTDTYNSPITVSLNIKDVPSGHTGTFAFDGTLTGKVTSNGTTVSASFDDPFTPQAKTLEIGTTFYTVSILASGAFGAPGAPPTGGSGIPGQYSLNVKASPVPEPGSLVLLGLGCFGATGLLRRRRHRTA